MSAWPTRYARSSPSGASTHDINNGRCDEFADEIARRVPGAVAWNLSEAWAHVVIRYEGFYYDAEEPYGVPHWRQLPLCVRSRRVR